MVLPLFSCKHLCANETQKQFKNDSYYFMALQAADEHDSEKAMRFFKTAREKGSPLVSRRSAEALTMLGNMQERQQAAKYIEDNIDNYDSLLIACREYYRESEFSLVISATDDIDFATAPNGLVQIRFNAMLEKKDSRFESEYYKWILSKPLSPEHLFFYQKYLSLKVLDFQKLQKLNQEEFERRFAARAMEIKKFVETGKTSEETKLSENIESNEVQPLTMEVSDEQKVITFRVNIYQKNYREAFSAIDVIRKIFETSEDGFNEQILSDIGKAGFYGTVDFYATAKLFDEFAKTLIPEHSFYAYFYAARLYDKAGRYQQQAEECFRKALEVAFDSVKFDNCLWYLLNFQLRSSTDDIIATLKTYGSRISTPEYFDDFFNSLSVLLLSNQKWQDFYKVWKETESNFSDYIYTKFAYISGRLIEEGLAAGGTGLKTRQAVDAFTKVLAKGGDFYYKVCALERLNLIDSDSVRTVMLTKGLKKDVTIERTGASELVSGYAAFGFPQKVYNEWLLNRKNLSVEDSIAASKFLGVCGEYNNTYNVQSLRIADRTLNNFSGKIPEELLHLAYPRFFSKEVENACIENELPEYLLFALIRSESFFDASVSSTAGASGLTQLMETTAADEARKLKLEVYDILDPETNVRMGAHYFKSLIPRIEDSPILALFAYNSGLSNVRQWVKAAKRDWAAKGKAPHNPAGISTDLLLETLPYAETREYGRKVVSAACLYAWLYYDMTPAETVREIMGD